MRTIDTYILLFVVTTIYAGLLAWKKHVWEPDFTWLEVIIGVVICLAAPAADVRVNGPYTAEAYEARVWLAFVVGGAPIVIWSIARTVRAWRRISQRIWRRDGESSATTLARECRGRAAHDD